MCSPPRSATWTTECRRPATARATTRSRAWTGSTGSRANSAARPSATTATARESQVLTAVKTVQEEPPTFDEHPVTDSPATLDRAPNRTDRPKELTGATWQIPFDGQNLYVTVNHDGHDILEVFVTGPVSPSVGKLASKMLRGGFNVREVARVFDTTTGTHSAWFNERLLTSPEQAIAECLMIQQRRLEGKADSGRAAKDASTAAEGVASPTSNTAAGLCPDCATPLKRTTGCSYCGSCGWSKC